MLKFFAGLVVGFLAGLCALPVIMLIGMNGLADRAEAAFSRPALVEPAGDARQTYRDCVKGYFAERGNAVEAITSCEWELVAWKASPSFAADWRGLVETDSDIRAIVEGYHLAMAGQ
ncbi:hypothetical protein [Mesorhizobium sp.]|uniref:hypothetical protein n=1 Tax=Mesorhizobium sp. TaxID=1871066 RepID=UPI000FE481B3|nr:hypothetical protein [Mesorhizobium sp.]RWK60324.1 MAG: hypothetical protein EOR49_22065 [Mesorhizobium sp.]RWM48459.1 MAG: hypothetical protein EOR76_12245 [Mesorhizobium sp.]RWM54929.1 MAG: hypothetical protein EOR78_16930 [Mesorhizobium sp.]RWM57330.1 MAG: hypothetical protein EOR79_16765 [Mesorhizobium sp.]RWN01375.1 MAG: hypothetical protein EOR85_15305 [Mesorhizobium sp.]